MLLDHKINTRIHSHPKLISLQPKNLRTIMKFDSTILLLASASAVGKLVSSASTGFVTHIFDTQSYFWHLSYGTAGNTLRDPAHSRRFLRECPPRETPWYCPWCDYTDEYKTYKAIQDLTNLVGTNDSFVREYKRITTGIFRTGVWIGAEQLEDLQSTWDRKGLTRDDRKCMASVLLDNWCEEYGALRLHTELGEQCNVV